MKQKQLTVAELIEALQTMPPGALVFTEGTECVAEATGVMLEKGDVFIEGTAYHG